MPLIDDLKIKIIFKNKAKKKGVNVTDFIYKVVQVLKENLYQIRINIQDTGLIKPIKLQDEGQLNYITSHKLYIKYIYILSLLTQYIEYIKMSERSNYYYGKELCI